MASTPTRNEEKKGSKMSQAATSLGGGPASMGVSLSRSEEFLTQISTELTDEALFTAGYHMNPVPTKEKQTQEQGTQISKHGDPTSRTTVSN
ncbi:ENOL protein, partial [Crocuta crocuta]